MAYKPKILPLADGGTAASTASGARTSLGLGTLATQSGTFSGTSSGTNTGDQTISDATITTSDITTNNVSTTKHGFAPKGDGDTAKFLNANGAYSVPAGGGTGDVVGPGSATDNALARFDTTTGKLIQNGVGVLTDTGELSGVTDVVIPISTTEAFQIKTSGGNQCFTVNTTATTEDIEIGGFNITSINQQVDLFAGSSAFSFDTPTFDTATLNRSNPYQDFIFNANGDHRFNTAAGNPVDQKAMNFLAPTYSATDAATITHAATIYIDKAPVAGTNTTITNPYALWIDAGDARFDGAVAISGAASASNLSGTNTGDQTISDATISTTDITTNNVSTSKHGFTPKLPNDATKYLNGTGAWTVPAGGGITGSGTSTQLAVFNGGTSVTSYVPLTYTSASETFAFIGTTGQNNTFQQGNVDWANPITDFFGANTYFGVMNSGLLDGHPEYGGALFGGLGDGVHDSGITLFGASASATPGRAGIAIVGVKTDGGTSITALADDELVCTMGTYGSDTVSVYANGDTATAGNVRAAGYANAVRTVTGNTTLNIHDGMVLVDTTGGNVTITLPAANAFGSGWGQDLIIKRTSGGINTLTVSAGSGDTIQGAASVSLVSQFSSQQIQADGANTWYSLSVI